MIPRVIHYCWFGGSELPDLESKCIESWSRLMPEWEIVRWDERNFDPTFCAFSEMAYRTGMWAFVSDCARFKILSDEGGVFLDTDVELLKSLETFRYRPGFAGFSNEHDMVNPGLVIGAEPGNRVMEKAVERYADLSFHEPKGRNYDLTSPVVFTELLEKEFGLKRTGEYQNLGEFVIFPKSYFDPIDPRSGKMSISSETFSIHRYSGTWCSPAQKYRLEKRKQLAKIFGPNVSWALSSIMSLIKYRDKAF